MARPHSRAGRRADHQGCGSVARSVVWLLQSLVGMDFNWLQPRSAADGGSRDAPSTTRIKDPYHFLDLAFGTIYRRFR
jgi:hypothetical protein